ncbi:hypothetical protein NpPPO83_00000520 [Neofusicoccum parvum]|uniref:Uncharacterized protein n=1 Tax=Neofusicoccum parvum TaxID=310453 RepID=A0ACB5SJ16_9PEZI|nr:hypothetical protein NpPPO83_00000520 [Neofusicoccum parvum]
MLKLLVKYGAQINSAHENGATPLFDAAISDKEAAVAFLLERGATVSPPRPGGWQPIHKTAEKGNTKSTQLLLNYGVSVHARTDDGETPLSLAALHNHLDVAKHLLHRGASPTTTDTENQTPLHHAAQNGAAALVQLLLTHGASPTTASTSNATALTHAARANHPAILSALLQHHDALSQLPTTAWETPTNNAARTGSAALLARCLDQLPQPPPDAMGRLPLHLAARSGRVEPVELLLARGADAAATDAAGRGVLAYAAMAGGVEGVWRALRLAVAGSVAEGWTALHWAARVGGTEVVAALVVGGVEERAVGVEELGVAFTPWAVARACGNEGLVGDARCPLRMREEARGETSNPMAWMDNQGIPISKN